MAGVAHHLVVAGVAAVLVLGGCQASPGYVRTPVQAGGPIDADELSVDVRWPFWPRTMRVHPLSRLVRDDQTGDVLVEARIELRDAWGDITKGYGKIELRLAEAPFGDANAPIAIWDQDLTDLDSNHTHFDEVTRTYLFRCRIAPERLPPRVKLYAYLLSVNGARLRAERAHELRVDPEALGLPGAEPPAGQ